MNLSTRSVGKTWVRGFRQNLDYETQKNCTNLNVLWGHSNSCSTYRRRKLFLFQTQETCNLKSGTTMCNPRDDECSLNHCQWTKRVVSPRLHLLLGGGVYRGKCTNKNSVNFQMRRRASDNPEKCHEPVWMCVLVCWCVAMMTCVGV